MNLTGPQRALVTTISNGQESIHKAEDLLLEKAKLPPLGNDPASYRWKATEKSTKKQSIHSQVNNFTLCYIVHGQLFTENTLFCAP